MRDNGLARVVRISIVCASLALAAPGIASAAWQEPVDGDQPINVGNVDSAFPSLASVGSVPYVAWQEGGGSESVVRVARLNAGGTAWEAVGGPVSAVDPVALGGAQPSLVGIGGVPYVGFMETDEDGDFQVHVARLSGDETAWERVGESDNPAKPINESLSQDSFAPSLTEVDGVPYVAWSEFDGTNTEIRVARLNAGGTGWEQPVGGASPINQFSFRDASRPSLTAVDGVPHVAWLEFDGGNLEVRVARLSDDETEWEPVGESVNPSSPINQSGGGDAREPSLTGIDGVPYVAWREAPPVTGTFQTRVARLSDDETEWEKVAGGASPINQSSAGQATDPSLIGIGGVPYVAWSEASPTEDAAWVARLNANGTAWEKLPDSDTPIAADVGLADPSLTTVGGIPYVAFKGAGLTAVQTRVSRLEPELQATAVAGDVDATLIAAVQAFDLPYEVGFEYGEAPGFGSETPTQTTSGDVDLISEPVTGLDPSTTYDFRAFALAGVPAPRIFGDTEQFTTDAAQGTSACEAARQDLAAAEAKLKKKRKKLRTAKRDGEPEKIKRAKRGVRKAKRLVAGARAAVEEACA